MTRFDIAETIQLLGNMFPRSQWSDEEVELVRDTLAVLGLTLDQARAVIREHRRTINGGTPRMKDLIVSLRAATRTAAAPSDPVAEAKAEYAAHVARCRVEQDRRWAWWHAMPAEDRAVRIAALADRHPAIRVLCETPGAEDKDVIVHAAYIAEHGEDL